MVNTVRKRILDAVKTALQGVTSVGLVLDAAARAPGTDDVGIGACVAQDHKHAIELVVFDDEANEAQDGTDVEAWVLPITAVIHLSDDLQGREPYDVAADICSDLYRLCRRPGEVETWGGLAIDTAAGPGYGVAWSDIATKETALQIRIKYRHTVGDPTEPR